MKHILGFLNTAPLWKKEQFSLQQFEMPAIDLSTFVPQPIPTTLRLGHQVEYIFKQLLEHSRAYEIVAHNIQVKNGNDTVGELDFILRDVRFRESITAPKSLRHIELTYKFYVLDPLISEPIHRLMGPNRCDMFFTKMEKTRDKQLPLVYTEDGRKTLKAINVHPKDLYQQTYFVGQLFIPYNSKTPSIRPLNTDCIVGYWLHFKTFTKTLFKKWQYYIPFKYEWLHEPHLECLWQSHYDCMMDINMRHINEHSPMVWIRKEDDTLEKCFVVWW